MIDWPDVPRIAFGAGPDYRLNAKIGLAFSSPYEMTPFVDGYKEAAEAVFKHIESGDGSPDFLVLPLAFLWRHCIELSLKEIIALGRLSEGRRFEFPKHHRLLDLWRDAKPYIVETGSPDYHGPEVDNVESNITEFAKIDPQGEGFRYLRDRRGNPSLREAPELLNVRRLHEALSPVANFLSGVSSQLMVWLEAQP
jgi:hypothetical protein